MLASLTFVSVLIIVTIIMIIFDKSRYDPEGVFWGAIMLLIEIIMLIIVVYAEPIEKFLLEVFKRW